MTDEQKLYVDQMDLWFKNEDNSNRITRSNIENASKMVELFSIEMELRTQMLEFDLQRGKNALADYNKWCDDNSLSQYKK